MIELYAIIVNTLKAVNYSRKEFHHKRPKWVQKTSVKCVESYIERVQINTPERYQLTNTFSTIFHPLS